MPETVIQSSVEVTRAIDQPDVRFVSFVVVRRPTRKRDVFGTKSFGPLTFIYNFFLSVAVVINVFINYIFGSSDAVFVFYILERLFHGEEKLF